jgi:hypothetical protein
MRRETDCRRVVRVVCPSVPKREESQSPVADDDGKEQIARKCHHPKHCHHTATTQDKTTQQHNCNNERIKKVSVTPCDPLSLREESNSARRIFVLLNDGIVQESETIACQSWIWTWTTKSNRTLLLPFMVSYMLVLLRSPSIYLLGQHKSHLFLFLFNRGILFLIKIKQRKICQFREDETLKGLPP